MVWYYWAGGAAALGGLGYIIYKGAQGASSGAGDSEPAPVAGTPMAAPLFMASGGGTMQSATNDKVLGGDTWMPAKVPLSENPDLAIAKLNADVNMAAIQAGKDVQLAGIQTAGQVKQNTAPALPTVLTPAPPPNTIATRAEFRGNNIVEGANFVKNIYATQSAAGSASIERQIYDAARANNYSATEVSQSFSAATGQRITPADINKWITDRGLAPL